MGMLAEDIRYLVKWARVGRCCGFLQCSIHEVQIEPQELRQFPKKLVPFRLSFRPPAALRKGLHSTLCAPLRALQANENPAQSSARFSVNHLSARDHYPASGPGIAAVSA
jgi:hypothetical protein